MNKKLVNYIIILVSVVAIVLAIFLVITNKKDVSFTIKDSKLVMKVNEVKKIDYSISNSNLDISWKSSDSNIVSVDNNGNITSKEIGNAIITGSVNANNTVKTISCYITVKAANYDIPLEDINFPEGEILLSTNEVYSLPINYIPENGYVDNINYTIEDNSVITVEDNFIKGISTGRTSLTVVVNNTIQKEIMVNVVDTEVINHIIKPVKQIYFNSNNETIYVNDTKTLSYTIEPSNADIYDIKWKVNDSNILEIDNYGTIKGLAPGSTNVEVTVNNLIKQYINITVKPKVSNIDLNYSPKKVIKVGDTFTLTPVISPSNIDKSWIVYESNNPNCLSISQDGLVTAKSRGNAIITIKSKDGNVSKIVPFVVYDKVGVVNNDQTIWGFNKETDVIPKKADSAFFTNLAKSGKGTFSNNIYTISNYSYDVNNNLLTIGQSNKIFIRIYYPQNKDLSTQNIFTFIGGIGEGGFGGYFADIEKNPSLIKSSGIIVLVPEHNSAKLTAQNVAAATNFVKLIINQNSKARNIIGGYSNGGPIAGETANIANYDKIVLINTSFYWVNTKTNIRNTEIVIYSARNDSWKGTNGFIGELYDNNFKNVTVISNNESIIERYKTKYLVINPGNSMKNGHTSENITLSHFFAYACD